MNGKQLKNSILQWAIQGKLVPQDPNDEPASVLLEKIRTEKAQLVKEGKLKKKDLEVKPIAEDEIPFEIPSSWAWCRLSDISACELGKALDAVRNTGEYVDYLTGINVYWNSFDFSQTRKMRMTDVEYNKYHLNKGDLVVCEGGDAGRCAVWKIDKPIAFQKALHRVRLYNRSCPDFYMYLMMVYQESNVLEPYITGTTIKHLTNVQLRNLVVPFPPLAEQHRIVAKIEELMPLVEKYGAAQEVLDEWNKALPEKLKKSILQEAIQGKLVPQDPADEPASALLERIREEKMRLVKEGKLKKKDLEGSTIFRGDDNKYYEQIGNNCIDISDEIPFSIPDNWEWCRLKQLCKITMGQSPDGESINKTAGVEFHQGKIQFGKMFLNVSDSFTNKPTKIAEANTLLLCVRAPVGTLNITNRQICIGRGLCSISLYYNSNILLLFYFLSTYKQYFEKKATGSTFKAISNDIILETLIPLPPIREQKRIVERIQELLSKL